MRVVGETETTVIMVTHDIEEALFLADRIVFLSRRPASVVEELRPSYRSRGIKAKEEMLADHQYSDKRRHIMSLMRNQATPD